MAFETFGSDESVDGNARFDAIVVGSGAAGGVAAAQLCEAGLKVAVFEAGFPARGAVHPLTSGLGHLARLLDAVGAERRLPPVVARAGQRGFRLLGRARQPVQSKCFAWAMAPDVFVDDVDCAYETEGDSRFLWYRSRQPGGKMMVPGHGRQYYRLAGVALARPEDNEVGWPFGLEELSAWYGAVEDRLELKGGEQDPARPESSQLSQVLEPTPAEKAVMKSVRARWPEARPRIGNYAAPLQWLDLASRTGNLAFYTGAVVRRVRKTETGRAAGVEWFDSATGKVRTALAPVVFLCASAIESTRILLTSRSDERGPAIGTNSSALGCYLMDHAVMSGNGYMRRGYASDERAATAEHSEPGRCVFVPPDAAIHGSMGFQIHVHPRPDGSARVDIVSFAEMLPDQWNRVRLDPVKVDRYGMPVPVIRFQFSEAQQQMARRQAGIIRQIAEDLELTDFQVNSELSPGGASIHECGTARMGSDPQTSVVDPNNECWDIKGLYVTDGACFPRQHVHNPTLTIMALTARAAAHAAASQSATPDLASYAAS